MEQKIQVIPSNKIINSKIYCFLYCFLKDMFLVREKNEKNKKNDKIDQYLRIINDSCGMVCSKDKGYVKITREYNIDNLKNLFSFVERQNPVYAGDIIEGILIQIFSEVFNITKDKTFSKYIFDSFARLKNPQNEGDYIGKWIIPEKFKQKELTKLEEYISSEDEQNQEATIFSKFLETIYQSKYSFITNKDDYDFLFCEELNKQLFESLNSETCTYMLDKDIYGNSSIGIERFFQGQISKRVFNIKIVKSFLTTVYIYYQVKNSPLMDYITEKKDLAIIPFSFDLNMACVEGKYGYCVSSPVRQEARVHHLVMTQNNLRESGQLELSKILVFNDNVKTVHYNINLIRTYYLGYLLYGLKYFEINNIEELNISYNYLKEDSDIFLSKLITHFTGLKILNLTSNDLKSGLKGFFITLKDLYKKKKTKLEELILNKCNLDDSSLYELAELLKCKYCKLKALYLNISQLPSNKKLLKSIKNNKSLTKVFLNRSGLYNEDVDPLCRIISIANLSHIYLYKNRISDISYLLSLLARTKLVKLDQEANSPIGTNSSLINLDVSNNESFIKNEQHIKLFFDLVNKSTAFCLDFSHILLGNNPDKFSKEAKTEKYRKFLEDSIQKLTNDKEDTIKLIKNIYRYNFDFKDYEKECQSYEFDKQFENNEELNKIINDFARNKNLENIELRREIKNTKEFINFIKDFSEDKDIDEYLEKFNEYLFNRIKLEKTRKEIEQMDEKRKKHKMILI